MKNKVIIDDGLKKELKDYLKNYSIGIGHQIEKELTDITKSSIELFYDDYSPISYKRHYYNFRKYSFKKYYDNKHGSIIRAGVELTPNRMFDIYGNYNNGTPVTSYVFNLVYSGFHGNETMMHPNSIVHKMSPSPLEIIINQRDKILKNINKYKKYGTINSRKNKYQYI